MPVALYTTTCWYEIRCSDATAPQLVWCARTDRDQHGHAQGTLRMRGGLHAVRGACQHTVRERRMHDFTPPTHASRSLRQDNDMSDEP